MSTILRKFGWTPDVTDDRDFKFSAKKKEVIQIPEKIDLRNQAPIVVDQGPLSSCVGNAVAGIVQMKQIKQGKVYYSAKEGRRGRPLKDFVFAPSRLFIYWGGRFLEGTEGLDEGCQIRDAIKFVSKSGAATSSVWPYRLANVNVKPSDNAFQVAKERGEVLSYYRLDGTSNADKVTCLAHGYPFVFGFVAFESLLSDFTAVTGTVLMPKPNEATIGGHAVAVVGYDLQKKVFICRNSWGPKWGTNGYFTMPFAYVDNSDLSGDFWAVTEVE